MVRCVTRTLCGLLALSLFIIGPPIHATESVEEESLTAQVLSYLDDLRSLSGRYRQSAPDHIVAGDFYMQRPGRLHFAEDGDSGQLLIADGRWLAVIDQRAQITQRYALSGTPFGTLLGDKPSQNPDLAVHNVVQRQSSIFMTVAKRDEEELGLLTLIVRTEPMQLVGWIITDAQQRVTQVELEVRHINTELDDELFRIAAHAHEPGNSQ